MVLGNASMPTAYEQGKHAAKSDEEYENPYTHTGEVLDYILYKNGYMDYKRDFPAWVEP